MTEDQKAGLVFGGIMGTFIIAAFLFVIFMQVREKYGVLPRGFRWMEKAGPGIRNGFTGAMRRIFYGDVLKQREADRLTMERETGMTPWWNDTTKVWVRGDVEEVKNQHGFMIARRPRNYRNRVATPGVAFDKEQSA